MGDLDGDGDLDLATANALTLDDVSILLNDGDGGFVSHADYELDAFSRSVAIGDLDGDGDLDLALADGYGDAVLILKNGCISDDCPGELGGDDEIGADDLFQLLGAWGPCPGCPEDLTGDGDVNSEDLFQLLGAWGPCA
jgi:hypothetical protein